MPSHWRLPKPGVLSVVLLRCTSLQAPDGFSKANPMVSLSLCNGPIALHTKARGRPLLSFRFASRKLHQTPPAALRAV